MAPEQFSVLPNGSVPGVAARGRKGHQARAAADARPVSVSGAIPTPVSYTCAVETGSIDEKQQQVVLERADMKQIVTPPPMLNSARVLEYAILDESVSYSGHSSLFVDGKELGPVPCLAIGQVKNDTEVLLLHCAGDWTVLGTAGYPSVSDAKKRAEGIYAGVSTRWIEAHVTEEEAARYLNESWGDQRCSFCGKTPEQVGHLISKNNVCICDSCIAEFHQEVFAPPSASGGG